MKFTIPLISVLVFTVILTCCTTEDLKPEGGAKTFDYISKKDLVGDTGITFTCDFIYRKQAWYYPKWQGNITFLPNGNVVVSDSLAIFMGIPTKTTWTTSNDSLSIYALTVDTNRTMKVEYWCPKQKNNGAGILEISTTINDRVYNNSLVEVFSLTAYGQ